VVIVFPAAAVATGDRKKMFGAEDQFPFWLSNPRALEQIGSAKSLSALNIGSHGASEPLLATIVAVVGPTRLSVAHFVPSATSNTRVPSSTVKMLVLRDAGVLIKTLLRVSWAAATAPNAAIVCY